MVEIEVQDALWDEFVAIARSQQMPPQALAEQALREFIQRASDEGLLARSEQVARRSRFRIEETEQIIQQHRSRNR